MALCLAFAFSAAAAGCGVHISFGDNAPATEEPAGTKHNSAIEMAGGKADTQEDEPLAEPPKQETPENTQELPEEPKETAPPEEPKETAPLGSNYIDYENMQFTANGKTYTLGVNTLQDMIDDGVPFEADALADAGNNLNPNMESNGFEITLGDYWTAQVYAINMTEEGRPVSECPLSAVYLPVHEDETQSVLGFAFPLNITEDELIAAAGEPTDRSVYADGDYESVTVKYEKDSEKYYGSFGYQFDFTNGKLSYVNMNWTE